MNVNNLDKQINDLVNDFNTNLIILIKYVKSTNPIKNLICAEREIMNACIMQLHDFAAIKSKSMIDSFVIHILAKYEMEILDGNEDFFSNESNNDSSSNNDFVEKMLRFKTVWSQFSSEEKEYIKTYMQLLCVISRGYFDFVDQKNQNKKIYESA